MDLFTPLVGAEAQHPYFRGIWERSNGFDCDVLNEWARGFQDRDNKFVKEFQTSFDSSFWELYIFAVLKQYKLTVNFLLPSPDFVVNDRGGLSIEATVALHAQGTTPEHEKKDAPIPDDLNVFLARAIVRLRNSIDAKAKIYASRYSTLGHVRNRPFVLAITAVDSPYARLACQRSIEAALYGYYIDEERFLRDGGELEKEHRDTIIKDNGSEIPIGIFSGDEFAWLGAVMFSSCATWGKVRALSADPNPNVFFEAIRWNENGINPHLVRARKSSYTESLLDGLRVYHNPWATHPLDVSIFRHRDVFQAYYDSQTGWVYEQRDGLLLCRNVYTVLPRRNMYGAAC
jgi:hypothetical protein